MKIQYEDKIVDMDEEFSQKDFIGMRTVSIPDNVNVYGSCFSKEVPDTVVFPDNMAGVTFYNCNLDNVVIPSGNTVVGGSNKRFKVQNDLNDWLIDELDKPTMPVGHKIFDKFGLPMPLPKDIPLTKVDVVVNLQEIAEAKLAEGVI